MSATPHRPEEADLALWDTYRLGNPQESQEACEEIAIHYQYLVEGTARKLERRLPSFIRDEELISHGQLGLLKAMVKYNPESGPFSRYASSVIFGAVMDGLRHNDFAPRGLRKQQRELESAVQKIRDLGGDDPKNDEIAEALDMSLEDVVALQQKILRSEVTPQAPALLGAGRDTSNLWSREICREFVVWLKERDIETQKIIALKYWKGMSVKTISESLGLPVEQIRSRHQKVLSDILPFVRELAVDD